MRGLVVFHRHCAVCCVVRTEEVMSCNMLSSLVWMCLCVSVWVCVSLSMFRLTCMPSCCRKVSRAPKSPANSSTSSCGDIKREKGG